jgi:hypothetical protein
MSKENVFISNLICIFADSIGMIKPKSIVLRN